MESITCKLECGDDLEWFENQHNPDADLPWKGRIVWCERCEDGKEIIEVTPAHLDKEHIQISQLEPDAGRGPDKSRSYVPGDMAAIFFDTWTGTWAYTFYGVDENGNGYDSEDTTGFASPQEAEEAMRVWLENNKTVCD